MLLWQEQQDRRGIAGVGFARPRSPEVMITIPGTTRHRSQRGLLDPAGRGHRQRGRTSSGHAPRCGTASSPSWVAAGCNVGEESERTAAPAARLGQRPRHRSAETLAEGPGPQRWHPAGPRRARPEGASGDAARARGAAVSPLPHRARLCFRACRVRRVRPEAPAVGVRRRDDATLPVLGCVLQRAAPPGPSSGSSRAIEA